ncbi:MAG: zinc ribbon-containing protein [Lachnospiraceae bacterium]|jgi:predicted RNA-binding Zn-ribbon protein involved in translation (DUF1610 family)|nr:zinc ribbon-containing protein [Lachnospiraceae bacterium]
MGEQKDKWKRMIQQFMIGRYGTDPFARFLNVCIIILLVINLLARIRILYWIALAVLFYSYFRMFSKNTSARFLENERYLRLRFQAGEIFQRWKQRAKQTLHYHIYRCPGCGQKIRIPRGKGKVSIHCPKCHKDFIRRS